MGRTVLYYILDKVCFLNQFGPEPVNSQPLHTVPPRSFLSTMCPFLPSSPHHLSLPLPLLKYLPIVNLSFDGPLHIFIIVGFQMTQVAES